MLIKHKLSIFSAVFFLLLLMFTIANIFLFGKLHSNVQLMDNISKINKKHDVLRYSVTEFCKVGKYWGYSANYKYRRMYDEKKNAVLKSFGDLAPYMENRTDFQRIGQIFEELDKKVNNILSFRDPVGDQRVIMLVRHLEETELQILSLLEETSAESLSRLDLVSQSAEKMKKTLSFYIMIIIIVFFLVSFALSLLLSQTFSNPLNHILTATDKISAGNLDYRIDYRRNDEFGLLSERFNKMIDKVNETESKLRSQLHDTRLLLDISKTITATQDLRSILDIITSTIFKRTEVLGAAVYLSSIDSHFFVASSKMSQKGIEFPEKLDRESEFAKDVLDRDMPVFYDKSTFGPGTPHKIIICSLMMDNTTKGLLVIAFKESVTESHELSNLYMSIANSISNAVYRVDLFNETQIQLRRLTAFYELGKIVNISTTFEELFSKVSEKMTSLLRARGCIIRIFQDDVLLAKSSHGLPIEHIESWSPKLGEGIAGTVAAEKKSLLIENVNLLPESMHLPGIQVTSVVAVPMLLGTALVGTIGLFDKKDDEGTIISFNHDDLATAEGFASITALAIEKIRNIERDRTREIDAIEAKKRMETLFDSVRGGIITLDRNWNILLANKYIESWTDKSINEIIGKNSIDVFHTAENMICPHCAAKATFETGEINTITQSRGINYAELSSYPIKDDTGEIIEVVIFIRDITDRVLYQEEILSLYKEVSQTKEYLESLIDNTPDAIVTSDIDGIIISWNKGAEKIYGYSEEEALNNFLPFVPDFLREREIKYIDRLKKGEIIKDIETIRVNKEGRIFEVSLTLSPIKDTSGEVIGITGISRDISEKKKVEKELIRRNQELSRLFFISSAMRGTLEYEKLLRMVLTAVTMSDGLGFNRALLFLVDEEHNTLRGEMGVGPASAEEAWQIWDKLSLEKKSLPELLSEVEESPLKKDSFLDRLSTGMTISLEDDTTLTRAVKEKKPINVVDVHHEPLSDTALIQLLDTHAYAAIPLVSRDKVLGLLWVDNYFNRKPITDEDIRFLRGFADQVAAALESARLFEQVKLAEAELENIFESISDMVYFNTNDYTIKNINKAVADKIGKPAHEIIGKKCYEIFHGMNRPLEICPHHKTVETKKAYVEEIDEPHLGGTFLTSSSPIFNTQGDFIGTVHVVRDITELKKLQDKLSMAERMAALGEVAAKVAHEIRNPLVSIGGFSRRLEKKLDGSMKEYASIISKEVSRLEEILREILGYVRDIKLSKEITRMSTIFEEALSLLNEQIRKKNIRIERQLDDTSAVVEVDVNRIKESLINILGNAIDILPSNGTIVMKAYTEDGYSVTEISDTGPGIDTKDLPYIFDPFYTTKVTGTGLGLAITHRIIEQHAGKIEVRSALGEGAVFKISIPIKEVSEYESVDS